MVKFEQNQFEVKHQPSLDLKVPVLIKKKRVRDQSIFMGIFLDQNNRRSSISQSVKTLKVLQDIASNARLIHAEGQNASIDDKISQVLNF